MCQKPGERNPYFFLNEDEWLERGYPIDPELPLVQGRLYLPKEKSMFGTFSDAAPDRYGKTLIRKQERNRAKEEGQKPRHLTETDFLLAVSDFSRMGAYRFALEPGEFLSRETDDAVPPWTSLRELESAAAAYEKEEDIQKWLKLLLGAGSSLGGARPKATVEAPDGELWIAKFPSKYDEWDVGAWEMTAHGLAAMCGIRVPEAKLIRLSDKGSTFLTKRFDREGEKRIPFMSAMTALGKRTAMTEAGWKSRN